MVSPSVGVSISMVGLVRVVVRLSVASVVSLIWAVLVTERAIDVAVFVRGLRCRGWDRSGNDAVVRFVLARVAGKFAVLRVETTMVLLLRW